MKYFKTADPNDDSQGDLSKRVHFLKCEKEGQLIMCEVTREIFEMGIEQGIEQGVKGIVQRMAKMGKNLKEIAEATGQTVECIKEWVDEFGIL